jgi:hypothetical protein
VSSARGACLIMLKRTLNDPDSAQPERTGMWYVEEQKDGTILVQPTGRAKNAFGAYIQGTWNCVVRPEGENVRVLSLKQIRPCMRALHAGTNWALSGNSTGSFKRSASRILPVRGTASSGLRR